VPRLRRSRDTDWTPTDEDFPEALSPSDGDQQDDAVDCSADRFGGRLYEGYEQCSGVSWLANDVIIGSLPDNKLRDALARYKALVRLCETELAARACVPRRPTTKNRVSLRSTSHTADAARQKRNKPSLLTPQQMLKALEMLMKLKEKHDSNR